MNCVAASFMILLLVMGALLSSGIPPYLQASTDEGSEGGSDEGNEGDLNGEDSNEEEGGESDEEGGATTPVTPTEPSAEEEANDNDNDNDDGNEPLPYCDNVNSGPCHDLDDYDEDTLMYPCNDGTQRANKGDCPDATQPVLPTQPNLRSSSETVIVTTYSIQGSGLPVQTGPIPIPKPGEAVLKIIYDDEWSGNILDSNMTSVSYDGQDNYSIVFPCEEDDGFFSLTVQKGDDDNEVLQLVVQNYLNQTLKQGQTFAEFGIVSLSGECEIS